MNGTLVHFDTTNLHHYSLSYPPNTTTNRIGYVTIDRGDYIRFIDRNGLVYVVPRTHTISRLIDGKVVYFVTGTYYVDMGCTQNDRECLNRFVRIAELHS